MHNLEGVDLVVMDDGLILTISNVNNAICGVDVGFLAQNLHLFGNLVFGFEIQL